MTAVRQLPAGWTNVSTSRPRVILWGPGHIGTTALRALIEHPGLDFVGLVVKHLKKGNKVRITGLGILQVRNRPARMGRNPATGEAIKIKASKKVAFRVAKDLKEAI